MERDPVEVVVARQEDEVVHRPRRADRVEGEAHRALGGDHLGRVALGKVDAHRRRPVEAAASSARSRRREGTRSAWFAPFLLVPAGAVGHRAGGGSADLGAQLTLVIVTFTMWWRTFGVPPSSRRLRSSRRRSCPRRRGRRACSWARVELGLAAGEDDEELAAVGRRPSELAIANVAEPGSSRSWRSQVSGGVLPVNS